jgi:hypothetical protein
MRAVESYFKRTENNAANSRETLLSISVKSTGRETEQTTLRR